MNKKILCATAGLISCILSGCVYRVDVPQGNYIEQDQVSKLRIGMTKEQVQFVLGTPITIDPFNKNRWNYVFLIQEGWEEPIQKNLMVIFDGNRMIDIIGDYAKSPDFSTPLDI